MSKILYLCVSHRFCDIQDCQKAYFAQIFLCHKLKLFVLLKIQVALQYILKTTLTDNYVIRLMIIDNDILDFFTFKLLDRQNVYLLDRVIDNITTDLTKLQTYQVDDVVD